jgi:hypothetical protein
MSAGSSSSKRVKVAAEAELPPEALRRTDTLKVILQYVGRGDWLYAGAVSHRWCDLYREVCIAAVRGSMRWKPHEEEPSYLRVPVDACSFAPTITAYGSAMRSLSKLQWACDFDMQLTTNVLLPRQAGRFASKAALLWARKQGLPWTADICEGAAAEGRLGMLQWLRTEQTCPWEELKVFMAALRSADIPTLDWLCHNDAAVERIGGALEAQSSADDTAWYDSFTNVANFQCAYWVGSSCI